MLTIKPDDENNAEDFWDALDKTFPAVASQLRTHDQATVDEATWDAIRKLEGFSGGPEYAPDALIAEVQDA